MSAAFYVVRAIVVPSTAPRSNADNAAVPTIVEDDKDVDGKPCPQRPGVKTGRCGVCRGTGEHEVYCSDCGTNHEHECGACDGSGREDGVDAGKPPAEGEIVYLLRRVGAANFMAFPSSIDAKLARDAMLEWPADYLDRIWSGGIAA